MADQHGPGPGGRDPDRRAVPTPSRLAGSTDPARRVRPVDYTATGAADPAPPSAATPAPRRRARTVALPRPAPGPPADALLTLGPEVPPGELRPLRVDEDAVRTVGVRGVTRDRLVEAVADPEDAWTSDGGISDHFCRGELVVQVRRADNAVIGAFSRAYALSVRPASARRLDELAEIAQLAAGRSSRRGAGTRVPTTRRDLLDRLERAGFVVTPGSGHGRVTHPDHPGLFVPMASTPSDVRFTRYAVAQIRRVFGVDLRS